MGDRCNIVVTGESITYKTFDQIMETNPVVFYGHWSGESMPYSLQGALNRRWRWSDPAYLARVIFCVFVGKDSWGDENGFGISTGLCDNEHPIAVVSTKDKQVAFFNEGGDCPIASWSFDQYIELSRNEIELAYDL